MKSNSTLFLKFVLALFALGTIACLIWFPLIEGRADGLDLVRVYGDPLILYIYISSTPFFIGLYQAFLLLKLIDTNKAFSQRAVNTLRNMKFASLTLIGFIAIALLLIRFFAHGDDPAGPTMLGFVGCFAFSVIAVAAAVFQRLLQSAVDLKSENDLTV